MTEHVFQIDERPCSEVTCPQCQNAIRYTTLHLTITPHPFMYCEQCSNVLLRDSDQERMFHVLDHTPDNQMSDAVMRYLEEMEAAAPLCTCGGKFTTWAYVKCPTCHFQIPYNDGVQDPEVRAHNRVVIVIDGAKVIGDSPKNSWEFRCRP